MSASDTYLAGWTAAFAVVKVLLRMGVAEYARLGDKRGCDICESLLREVEKLEK